MIRALLIGLLLATATAAGAEVRRMPPTDRCASDRGFVAFRAQLRAAIARRDAGFILSVAADDIEYSFGDSPGRAGFARAWGLARPATSGLWRELGAALRLGCAPDRQGALWAPSMSMPNDDDPDDASYEVAPLSWDVLALPPDDDGRGLWVGATLNDGRQGYVRRGQVRGFADYRAVFERRRGRWRLTAFVAGD